MQALSAPYLEIIKMNYPNIDPDTICETSNSEYYFKVFGDVLYVPTIEQLQKNLTWIDTLQEKLLAWNHNELLNEYGYCDWDNLTVEYVEEDLQSMTTAVEFLMEQDVLAVDIETKNTDFEGNKLLAIGFAWSADAALTLYFTEDTDMSILEPLQKLFSKEDIVFAWQGGKFDIARLRYLVGLEARVDEDTMLQHYVGINEKRGTHGLKTMAPLYLNAPQWDDKLQELKKQWCRENKVKLGDFSYDMLPKQVLLVYLGYDCISTFRLAVLFDEIMRPESKDIYKTLIKGANVFADIEMYGCYVDQDYIDDLDTFFIEDTEKLMEQIDEVAAPFWDRNKYMAESGAKSAPDKFKITSPKQLKWLLKTMGIKVDSTNAATLEKIQKKLSKMDKNDPDVGHALTFVEATMQLRKNNKMHKTYVKGLSKQRESDGRVRCSFNLHGTETGRLSSSDPNLHNIPREKRIKNIFTAPEGKVLLQLDYSQAELRVLAVLSDDPWLKQVYIDGKDLHDAVATAMYGPDFDKEQRVMAKTINFGIAYGRGPDSIAEVFGITKSAAKKQIDDWFKPMPKVKEFIEYRRKMPFTDEPCTTCFGRTRHFTITNKNKWSIPNEAVNFPIQSVASDLTLSSLIDIHMLLQSSYEPNEAHIVNTVHDSIIIETTEELAAGVRDLAVAIMESKPMELLGTDVPFKADAEIGTSWGALKDF